MSKLLVFRLFAINFMTVQVFFVNREIGRNVKAVIPHPLGVTLKKEKSLFLIGKRNHLEETCITLVVAKCVGRAYVEYHKLN